MILVTLLAAAAIQAPDPNELIRVKADLYRDRVHAQRVHEWRVRVYKEHRRHRRLVARLRRLRAPRAVQLARRFLGTPYVWGGAAPGGFDCSGLVQYVYRRVGVWLPRTTWEQRYSGRWIPLSQLRRGDVVFAYGYEHEALYIGGGYVIEAPHTGAVVRVTPLSQFPIDEARRVA